MDYKLNMLNTEVQIDEPLLQEIRGLRFGIIGVRRAVFDYYAYFEENELDRVDYKVFMRLNKHFIESISKQLGMKTSELFYQDKAGKILVASELALLFVAFANPAMLAYFNGLLVDILSDGVAFSNGYIYDMAASKLPSETLESIIKERKEDNESERSVK